jgi:hypothetical protein
VLTLTTFSDNADIFVSQTVQRPTASNCDWSSTNDGVSLDVLAIPVTSSMTGRFYVSVFGSCTAVYRLMYVLHFISITRATILSLSKCRRTMILLVSMCMHVATIE